MASTTIDKPPSSSALVNAPASGATDAKQLPCRCCCMCQQPPRDCQNEEDTTTREVAVGLIMHPLLLAAACNGSWEELNLLLNRENAQAEQGMMPEEFLDQLAACSSSRCITSSTKTKSDVEEGSYQPAPLPPAASLLVGVTVEGDTALHVVAANGDGDNFLKCAKFIYSKATHLLFEPNKKGDTPLHCAARAGKPRMVSHLIHLARSEGGRDQELLRKENGDRGRPCTRPSVLETNILWRCC